MKKVLFKGYASFGKLDSCDIETEFELSDEDFARLEAEKDQGYFRLSESAALGDIYDTVYQKMYDEMKASLKAQFEEDGEVFDEGYMPDMDVNFPDHLFESDVIKPHG